MHPLQCFIFSCYRDLWPYVSHVISHRIQKKYLLKKESSLHIFIKERVKSTHMTKGSAGYNAQMKYFWDKCQSKTYGKHICEIYDHDTKSFFVTEARLTDCLSWYFWYQNRCHHTGGGLIHGTNTARTTSYNAWNSHVGNLELKMLIGSSGAPWYPVDTFKYQNLIGFLK